MLKCGKVIGSVMLISSVLLSSGCAMMAAPEADFASRNMALQRWERCVERYTSLERGALTGAYRDVEALCDGHRRDVAATYPNHLENQVAQRLSERANELASTRLVNTSAMEAWTDPQGTHVNTFKVHLREARQGDL